MPPANGAPSVNGPPEVLNPRNAPLDKLVVARTLLMSVVVNAAAVPVVAPTSNTSVAPEEMLLVMPPLAFLAVRAVSDPRSPTSSAPAKTLVPPV